MKPNNQMARGLYPGSFDPITYGHIDIVRRFSLFFEKLIVLTASSIHKSYWFSLDERAEMAREALKNFPNVTVESWSGLTVDYARQKGVFFVLRGVRSISDLSYERDLAVNNKKMHSDLETFLVFSQPGKEVISAKLIKEIAARGGDLSNLVPDSVAKKITEKLERGLEKNS